MSQRLLSVYRIKTYKHQSDIKGEGVGRERERERDFFKKKRKKTSFNQV